MPSPSIQALAAPAPATVRSLGYLQLGVSDLAAWEKFAGDILGCMLVPAGSGSLHLRLDDYSMRIVLKESSADDLEVLGWEVANAQELQAMEARIGAMGLETRRGSEHEAAARNVLELLRFADVSGLVHEIYYGPGICHEAPFKPHRAHGGFQTGEQGIGHTFLAVTDGAAADKLYHQTLGMRLTDKIYLKRDGRETLCSFSRCNSRHHSIAFGEVGGPKRLQHMMLQVNDLDDVGRTQDIAMNAGVRMRRALGKHSNDHMLSFYMNTPSGFQIEYGWGAVAVDEARWSVQTHQVTSKWGHQVL